MNTSQNSLPITEMLQGKRNFFYERDSLYDIERAGAIYDIIPQVRALEESQQKKIREEERARIVGILEEIIKKRKEYRESICTTSEEENTLVQNEEALRDAIVHISYPN